MGPEILTKWLFQDSLPSYLAASFQESDTEAARPFLNLWHLNDIIFPYAIGQSSHKSPQIQVEDKQISPLNGRSIKEFMSILNLSR